MNTNTVLELSSNHLSLLLDIVLILAWIIYNHGALELIRIGNILFIKNCIIMLFITPYITYRQQTQTQTHNE